MSLIGQNIGRYKILERLGQGGMSIVYKGLDVSLEREVAVKVLHPHLAEKEESRRRLEREAKAVARLKHPNILEVYDFASDAETDAYIVTEYIRGQTLREVLKNEPLTPPEVALMIVHELASALAHAHTSGVIHRDLKPDNVMVREDGVIKLMDFGIAKVIDRDDKMTMTGALVGSPAHMAPEIIEGEEAGAAADVFSLGTMLYLMVTGKLPFTASNTTATLRRILDGVYEDPRQISPLVSDGLAELIARCLHRDPKQRFENAVSMHAAVQVYLESLSITHVSSELVQYFKSPDAYRTLLVPQMVSALIQTSEGLLTEDKPAKALSALSHVLALDGNNARAKQLLEQMNQSRLARRRRDKLKKAGFAIFGLLLVGAITRGAVGSLGRRPLPNFEGGTRVVKIAEALPPTPQPPEEPPVQQPPKKAQKLAVVLAPPPLTIISASTEAKVSGPETLSDVVVNIRPWGNIHVDRQPASTFEQMRHTLKLSPGKHIFRIECEKYCLPSGQEMEVLVEEGTANTFNFPAPLKPAKVSFSGFPADAWVSISNQRKKIVETTSAPFIIHMPPEGSTRMGLKINWEVSRHGYHPASGTEWIEPGGQKEIRGNLEPE